MLIIQMCLVLNSVFAGATESSPNPPQGKQT